jgi:hypothetical protein
MTESKSFTTHSYDLSIRILFYRETDLWVAHALEMDLLGYGKTTQLALTDLLRSVKAQMSFAAHKRQPESVFFPAPADIVKKWEKAQLSSLVQAVSGNRESAAKMDIRAAVVTFTGKQLSGFASRKGASKSSSSREQWEPTLAAA